MRHIAKGAEPDVLRGWKRLQQAAGIRPVWGDFRNPEKSEVHTRLLEEQGCVCCYCGARVTGPHPPGGRTDLASHIDHLDARSTHPSRQLDYSNLVASCSGRGYGAHCGHARGDKALQLTPLEPDCETAFRYGSDGSVRQDPASPRSGHAQQVIGVLRLDDPVLITRRFEAIGRHLDVLEDEDDAALAAEIRSCLERDDDGRYEEFGHVAAQVLTRYLPSP